MEQKQVEVKQISEREFWVGESRWYLGEDDMLYFTDVGECDEEKVIACKKVYLKFINMVEGKVSLLVDVNKAGKQSPEARKIWKELSEHEKTAKIALFGLHPVARVIASFVMGISKNKDMRFFKTKEEALAWLKE
ncbi:MAG: STAS/SEC14 domain-containing protein [Bacteroidetes bacterium]|nr:STAS/SEC14 domain-containing protein [Bacteroidota bacterium]